MLEHFTREEVQSGVVERPGGEPAPGRSFDEVRDALAEALLQDSLAALLKSARASAQLSLADVAERLSVSRGWIHQLEQDGANLQIATLARLADALGYDVRVTFVARDEGRSPLSAPLR
jgi:ribosome-binding protein aMBF1 (putative translation factor)